MTIDFETILDRTKDFIDYAFVYKHFNKKWSTKYSVRERRITKGYAETGLSSKSNKSYQRDGRDFNSLLSSPNGKKGN